MIDYKTYKKIKLNHFNDINIKNEFFIECWIYV